MFINTVNLTFHHLTLSNISPLTERGKKSSNQKNILALYQAAKSSVLVREGGKKLADRIGRLKNTSKERAPTRDFPVMWLIPSNGHDPPPRPRLHQNSMALVACREAPRNHLRVAGDLLLCIQPHPPGPEGNLPGPLLAPEDLISALTTQPHSSVSTACSLPWTAASGDRACSP